MILWNSRPDASNLAFVDFETASNANLREVGSHRYVRDPSTRLLSAVFQGDFGRVIWVPKPPHGLAIPDLVVGDLVPDVVARLAGTHTWVAHNAEGFDAMLWEALYPDITPQWADSMHRCRVAGLPAGIDAACRALGLPGKDAEGSKIMKLMTTRPGAVGTVPLWEKLIKYNVQDVAMLSEIWAATPAARADELALHSRINEKGVYVDKAFAMKLHEIWCQVKCVARDEIATATGGKLTRAKASSGPAVHAWLKSVGVEVKTLRKDYLQSLLANPEGFNAGDNDTANLVAHVLRLRAYVVRAGEGKVARLIDTLDRDSRLRRMFVYHGASTGRFSSRVVQVHNLPKGDSKKLDVEALLAAPLTPASVIAAAEKAGISPSDVLATLVRPSFAAEPGKELAIADFASIEARCVAWMSGEMGMLDAFASGRDIYCDMASSLYGRGITAADKVERGLGKVIVLGCGYQMGPGNFGHVCKAWGIDLAAAGVTAEECVKAYRAKYPAIPAMWRTAQAAAMEAVRTGGVYEAGRVTYKMRGLNLVATLPSGRDIIYREARIVLQIPGWAVLTGQLHVPPCDCLVYTHAHGYEKSLYGGLLTENASQATARDLMVEAAIRYDRVRPDELVLHVHDELVAESADAPAALHELCREMSVAPGWAAGFPVEVEGFTGSRYTKAPFRNAVRAHYRGGVQI